jgi:hypothetical protein
MIVAAPFSCPARCRAVSILPTRRCASPSRSSKRAPSASVDDAKAWLAREMVRSVKTMSEVKIGLEK